MIACMHAMLHIAMSVLGHWVGERLKYFGDSRCALSRMRSAAFSLTVPYDLFPSWASGAADKDAGEKAK
jgi:hypothetical protein